MTRLLLSTAVLALIAAPSLAEAKKPHHATTHKVEKKAAKAEKKAAKAEAKQAN